MLEARIVAPRGSLYCAVDATPYDLETLREHMREFRAERGADAVTLELTIDDGPGGSLVTAWLYTMKKAGFAVRVLHHQHTEHAA